MCAHPTTKEIKEAFPDEKNDALWTRFVLRPISFPLAAYFLQLRLSANQVTYISILCVIVGSGLFAFESYSFAIVAAIFFNFFALLDCVDGNIARVTGENPYGQWVDALGGYIAYSFLFLSVGVFVESTYGDVWILQTADFVLVGASAAVANLLIRVQHQKFKTLEQNDGDDNSNTNSIIRRISKNFGITGFLMPLIFLGTFVSLLHIVILLYAIFYSLSWIIFTSMQLYRIEVVNK